ncbi:hypothetical protein ACS0TY_006561 [Phlomoides rotata]
MEPSSAPGPDGFGGSFYHSCWDVIATNVIEAIRYFFTTRHIPFGLNSSFVTLIPKKPGANRVEEFRPIVMVQLCARQLVQIPKAPRYLLYADDILIFAKATPSNIRQLHHIFSNYGVLSGQLYNPSKSKVYFGSTVTHRVKNAMLRTTGISEGALPFSYLGVPIFRGAPRTGHLVMMADSIIAKFSKWKGHALSLAGRKCMINSIIAASLVHSMMVYYWPRSLLKKIETAMRNFLWSGDISKKSTSCSVSWARCCSPINEGGLGIRSLRLANESFVCKLAWDILCITSLTFSLIHSRYITARDRPHSYGRVSSKWPNIRRHLSRLINGSRWSMGHTSHINFWNDNWFGYTISAKLGNPSDFADSLTSTIGDYFYDEHWHFDYEFIMKHTDIVRDILSVHVSRGDDCRSGMVFLDLGHLYSSVSFYPRLEGSLGETSHG